MSVKEIGRFAEFPEPHVTEDVANIFEARIGVVGDAKAYDFSSGRLERLRKNDGETAPAGNKSYPLDLRKIELFGARWRCRVAVMQGVSNREYAA